ncbi:MAG: helix-turn-helix domain-containing protein [Armatimonadota bacterium]
MNNHRNHLQEYLGTIEEYWFHGPQRKFARDAGIPETTLSRILRKESTPTFPVICRIVRALEKKLGRKIDPREIFEP